MSSTWVLLVSIPCSQAGGRAGIVFGPPITPSCLFPCPSKTAPLEARAIASRSSPPGTQVCETSPLGSHEQFVRVDVAFLGQ